MFEAIKRDVQAALERDPAAQSRWEVLLCYSGLHALLLHRFAHWLWRKRLRLIARFLSQAARFLTGIEIHPAARIGKGLLIDHGMGVVIGETAEVGDNCTFYQGVTLGGTGKEKGKRHPTIGNNVVVGVGAKLLGFITVGDNSIIGANAVVLNSVPPNCTAVGVPARIVRENGQRVLGRVLSGGTTADPLLDMIERLATRLESAESKLAVLQERLEAAERQVSTPTRREV